MAAAAPDMAQKGVRADMHTAEHRNQQVPTLLPEACHPPANGRQYVPPVPAPGAESVR